MIPNIVPEKDVLAANALSSITWSFCLAAGASLGGVVAVLLGPRRGLPAECGLVPGLGVADPPDAIRGAAHGRTAARSARATWSDFSPVIEGARYIRADRRLFATVFVKGGIGLLGANNVLLPILGQRAFPVHFTGSTPLARRRSG